MGRLEKISEDANKQPLYHILIIIFFAIGFVSLPVNKLFAFFIADSKMSNILGGIAIRTVLFLVFLFFFYKYKFNRSFLCKTDKGGTIAFIIGFIVCLNNFPFFCLIKGDLVISNDTLLVTLFFLYCLSVALFEEIVFRGIIFPLCLILFKDKKAKNLLAIITSSLLFSLIHILNLFAGESILSVLLQIGYTFLTGAVFCICLYKTKNIFVSVLLHFVYDIGGLFCSNSLGIAEGLYYNVPTVIITVIIALFATVYYLYTIKKDLNKLQE